MHVGRSSTVPFVIMALVTVSPVVAAVVFVTACARDAPRAAAPGSSIVGPPRTSAERSVEFEACPELAPPQTRSTEGDSEPLPCPADEPRAMLTQAWLTPLGARRTLSSRCAARQLESKLGVKRRLILPDASVSDYAHGVWSHDGRRLAVIQGNVLTVFRGPPFVPELRVEVPHAELPFVAFAPHVSSALLVRGCAWNGKCQTTFFDAASGAARYNVELKQKPVDASPTFSPSGNLWVDKSSQGFVAFDSDTGRLVSTFKTTHTGLWGGHAAFSPGEDRVALSFPGGSEVFDVRSGRRVALLGSPSPPFDGSNEYDVGSVFDHTGEKLYVSSVAHSTIEVWGVRQRRVVANVAEGGDLIVVDRLPGELWLATRTKLWHIDTFVDRVIEEIELGDLGYSLAWPARRALYMKDGGLWQVDLRTRKHEPTQLAAEFHVPQMSPTGAFALLSRQEHIDLVDVGQASTVTTLTQARWVAPEIQSFGRRFWVLRHNHESALWEATTGKRIASLGDSPSFELSPDERRLASVSHGRVMVACTATPNDAWRVEGKSVLAAAWSEDSRRIALLFGDAVELWGVEERRRLWRSDLEESTDAIYMSGPFVVAGTEYFDVASGKSVLAEPPQDNVFAISSERTSRVKVCPSALNWGTDALSRISDLVAPQHGEQVFRFALSNECRQLARPPGASATAIWSLPDVRPLVELTLASEGGLLIGREVDAVPEQAEPADENEGEADPLAVVARPGGRFVVTGNSPPFGVHCNVGHVPVPAEACIAASTDDLLATLPALGTAGQGSAEAQ